METAELEAIKTALPYFLKHKTMWASYDSEADVYTCTIKNQATLTILKSLMMTLSFATRMKKLLE